MTQTHSVKASRLKEVEHFGQSIWYDGLISIDAFKKLIQEDGIKGATTNPTIFEKALVSDSYSADLAKMVRSFKNEEIYQSLAVRAVQEVADVFLPVFQETRGLDGFVSIEVSPLLARDTQKTLDEARALWRLVNRKNLMIKVPATKEGIPAISTLIAEGINVNITLIFSVDRYQEVMDAYLARVAEAAGGVERATLEVFLDLLKHAYRHGHSIFVLGNGGSAANASHFAQDLAHPIEIPCVRRVVFRIAPLLSGKDAVSADLHQTCLRGTAEP